VNGRESEVLEALLESAATAHRERDLAGRLIPPPAWWDLAPAALDELFRRQVFACEVERALDPAGRSGTVKAVMGRILGA
jgi:hypothetical protein